jgi:hypothetical protein
MHKTRKRHGTYGTRSIAGGASSISMRAASACEQHQHARDPQTTIKLRYTNKDHPKRDSLVTINALICKKVFSLQEGIP